jgi:hypothetical protein
MPGRPPTTALHTGSRAVIAAALALCTGSAAIPASAQATSKGTTAILAEEALHSDERMVAYLTRFKAALAAREGGDPTVLILKASEVEGSALVVKAPGAPPEHVIWQEGKWIPNTYRELRPWAPANIAAAHPFRVSEVREATVREAMRAYRRAPGKATDYLSDLEVGYDPDAGALIARLMTSNLSSYAIGSYTFDLASGKSVVIVRAAPPKPPPRQTDDVRGDIARALAAVRSAAPDKRLGAVRIEKRRIDITLADRSTYQFDRSYTLKPGERYDGSWLCEKGFVEEDVDWARLPELAQNAIIAANLDDEDEPYARYLVDRSRNCDPVEIEVTFDNYEIPQPWVKFDSRGRYKSKQ